MVLSSTVSADAAGWRLPYLVSTLAGFVVGAWVAWERPTLVLFERTMRAIDVTGPLISPLSLLWCGVAILLASLVAFAAAWIAVSQARRLAARRAEGSDGRA